MSGTEAKADLQRYLQSAREAVLWKLEGVSEYDRRRPLTPTATNLLGLVKHLAGIEAGYFGVVFGRPFPDAPPWIGDDSDPNVDMWATAQESADAITGLYRRVWAHSDATIAALPLHAPGRVPWWAPRDAVTLHRVLVHVVAETNRHAGHADIVRELVDGEVGLRADNDNMADGGPAWWAEHRDRVERAAREAAGASTER